MAWKTELRPFGLYDPETGEPLYAATRIRPAWYWWARRVWFFSGIVWRVFDEDADGNKYRLDIATAWAVSAVAMGDTE